MSDNSAFQRFTLQKTREAEEARIELLATVFNRDDTAHLRGIGNAWSRRHYGGEFGLADAGAPQTSLSLVFIQSRDGNTGGANPETFGGGATDKHLIYEGLSRVAADAVLAGAGSVHRDAFFSVWRPELVALRLSLGLPRHPTQIVVSKRGMVDLDARLFTDSGVPVVLIGGDACIARHEAALRARPWIRQVRLRDDDLRTPLEYLRGEAGLQRISAIGGRFTATRLVDEGLAQDIYLTTTPHDGGEAGTPWYAGASRPPLTAVTEKHWVERGSRIVFEHLLIG